MPCVHRSARAQWDKEGGKWRRTSCVPIGTWRTSLVFFLLCVGVCKNGTTYVLKTSVDSLGHHDKSPFPQAVLRNIQNPTFFSDVSGSMGGSMKSPRFHRQSPCICRSPYFLRTSVESLGGNIKVSSQHKSMKCVFIFLSCPTQAPSTVRCIYLFFVWPMSGPDTAMCI